MKKIVSFRDFELRDVDFIYKAKNDRRVNATIVGDFKDFSFEEAVEWVRGCMSHEGNYRYWAVCSNDENLNIVGWCGISDIDLINKSACFRTITIYHPQYRDTIAWYATWSFVLNYVFEELKLIRLSATCLPTNKFHYNLLAQFPNAYEGIMKQSICKNGEYVDVALFSILRDEYLLSKNSGVLDFEVVQSQLKQGVRDRQTKIIDINDFIYRFSQELDQTDPRTINPDTKFRDLDEWSSLLAINLVAIAEGGLRSKFDMNDLNQCDTIADLYEKIISKN